MHIVHIYSGVIGQMTRVSKRTVCPTCRCFAYGFVLKVGTTSGVNSVLELQFPLTQAYRAIMGRCYLFSGRVGIFNLPTKSRRCV